MSKKLKKVVSVTTSVTTVLWLSGIAMLAPMAAQAVDIVDGDLMKTADNDDVYIAKLVGAEKFKRLILNPDIFNQYGHLKWENIKTVSQATIDEYTVSDLVRAIDDQPVYKLSSDAGADTGTKQWLNMTAAEFDSDGYVWNSIYIINNFERDSYTTGSDITPGEEPPSDGTLLSVVLASDTPAAGIAIANAIRVPFTKVNLTASSDGDITVDKLTVERTGVALDADLDHLVLVDEDTNLQIGLKQTINSTHQSTFNDDFVVEAGTTKTIILGGNVASSPGSGDMPSLSLVEIVLKGDATVSGTLPIVGNPMTTNSAITLGQITVYQGAYQNATTTSLKIGETAYTVAAYKLSANSTEPQNLEQIKFYQRGTAVLGTDVNNFKLYLDDATDLGATITVSGKYVTADLSSSPLVIAKGMSKELSLKADILDGSLRTVQMGIYRTTDILAKGATNANYRVSAYSGTGYSSATSPVMTSPQYTISVGTLRIDRSTTVGAENVAPGDDVTIGAFDFVIAGEPIDVTEIVFGFSTTITNGLKNVKIVDSTGSAVWGPDDVADGEGYVTFSSTVRLPVGTNTLTVKATLQSHAFNTADETFYATTTSGNITATGVTTGDSVTATPSSVSASTMTVKVGALAASRDALPADANVVLGQQDFLFGSWKLSATNSGEDVRITAIKIGNRTATTTNVDALTLYDNSVSETECASDYPNAKWDDYGCALDPVKDGSSGTSTFTLTNPMIVTKGGSKSIQLRADIRTTAASYAGHKDEFMLYVDSSTDPVTAAGVSTGNSISVSGEAESGALITIASTGSLVINLDSATPSAKIVTAGETVELARIKLTASNEAIDITQLVLNIDDGGLGSAILGAGEADDVETFYLYKSGESEAFASDNIPTNSTTTTFNISKGVLQVPKDTTAGLVIIVKAKMAGIGTGQTGTSGAGIKIGLGGTDGIKGYGVASGSEVTSETHTQSTSTVAILHRSQPTVSYNTLAATKLQSGAIMFDFNVTNDGSDPIALYRLSFWTTTSTDIDADSVYIQAKLDGEATYSTISANDNGREDATDNEGTDYETFSFVLTSKDATSETKVPYVIAGGKTARFQMIAGTINGAGTLGEHITTYFLGDAATSTSADILNDTDADAYASSTISSDQGNFVWSDLHSTSTAIATHYGADSNATATKAQWWNGYLVSGLQTTSSPQTLTY